jgi:hypothetical protein
MIVETEKKALISLYLLFMGVYFVNSLINLGFVIYFDQQKIWVLNKNWSSLFIVYLILTILNFIVFSLMKSNLLRLKFLNISILLGFFFLFLDKIKFNFFVLDFLLIASFLIIFLKKNAIFGIENDKLVNDSISMRNVFSSFSMALIMTSISIFTIEQVLLVLIYPNRSVEGSIIANEEFVVLETIKNLLLLLFRYLILKKMDKKPTKINIISWIKFLILLTGFYIFNVNFSYTVGLFFNSSVSHTGLFLLSISIVMIFLIPCNGTKLKTTITSLKTVNLSLIYFLLLFFLSTLMGLISMNFNFNIEFVLKLLIITFILIFNRKLSSIIYR